MNRQERFQHLNESQHNYLRITLILKNLGELRYESHTSPHVKFILHEALMENTIPSIKKSTLEYFVYTIRDRRERRKSPMVGPETLHAFREFYLGDRLGEKSQREAKPGKCQPRLPPVIIVKLLCAHTHRQIWGLQKLLLSRSCKQQNSWWERGSQRPLGRDRQAGKAGSSHSQPEKAMNNPAEKKESASPRGKSWRRGKSQQRRGKSWRYRSPGWCTITVNDQKPTHQFRYGRRELSRVS